MGRHQQDTLKDMGKVNQSRSRLSGKNKLSRSPNIPHKGTELLLLPLQLVRNKSGARSSPLLFSNMGFEAPSPTPWVLYKLCQGDPAHQVQWSSMKQSQSLLLGSGYQRASSLEQDSLEDLVCRLGDFTGTVGQDIFSFKG